MKNTITLALITLVLALGCKQTKKENQSESQSDSSGITLTLAPYSPSYPEASLTKVSTDITATDSAFAVEYSFDVLGYELGVQTADASARGIANSGKGQHIHFIVNNGPYSAHYMPGMSNELEAGNYVVLSFLSRSYHESVKSEGAFHVENLTVGDVEKEEVDLSRPHMFFSRPKGSYSGSDTEKLMLDFYLLNCDLSPNGYNVKATINGEEFLIDTWAPHYIEGLPMGEVTIKLELMDGSGNIVDSPFNPAERSVTLVEPKR